METNSVDILAYSANPLPEETTMKAKIDADLCTACELCTSTVPEVFQMGDEVAEVIVDEVPGNLEDAVKEAAEDCPVEAITVE